MTGGCGSRFEGRCLQGETSSWLQRTWRTRSKPQRLLQFRPCRPACLASQIASTFAPRLLHESHASDRRLTDLLADMARTVGSDGFVRQQTAAMNRSDGRDVLTTLRCPALVLCGREDQITPPALSEEMADLLTGSVELAVIDAGTCRHWSNPALLRVHVFFVAGAAGLVVVAVERGGHGEQILDHDALLGGGIVRERLRVRERGEHRRIAPQQPVLHGRGHQKSGDGLACGTRVVQRLRVRTTGVQLHHHLAMALQQHAGGTRQLPSITTMKCPSSSGRQR